MAFGHEDSSYKEAGGYDGLVELCTHFYQVMDTAPEAKKIRDMHPEDLEESTDKLVCFLSGWLGGPRLFQEKYGPIRIPMAHAHLDIDTPERDAWMICMHHALEKMNYSADFKKYLLEQLFFPAEKIRQVSQARIAHEAQNK